MTHNTSYATNPLYTIYTPGGCKGQNTGKTRAGGDYNSVARGEILVLDGSLGEWYGLPPVVQVGPFPGTIIEGISPT